MRIQSCSSCFCFLMNKHSPPLPPEFFYRPDSNQINTAIHEMNIILRKKKFWIARRKGCKEEKMKFKLKAVSFTEPTPPLPVLPASPASPALIYLSLPQSDSREERANDLLDGDSLH